MTDVSSATDDLALARAGDDDAFTRLVAPLRRELHAHCYRMLGSAHDADDALQEGMVRAWRHLSRFEGRSSLRSWLYSVTTRTCLDAVAGRRRRALPMDLGPASDHTVLDDVPRDDVPWLTPYPDVTGSREPAARYEQREAVELAFVAACQHLPGNQRAALLLFDVLGFSAAEIAELMDTTTASVTSALQRARRTVADRVPPRSQAQVLRTIDDAELRAVVTDYAGAFERGDTAALAALLTEDVTWSMPPLPHWYSGRDRVLDFARRVPMTRCGFWRHRVTRANGQPAVASYLSRDDADGPHDAWSINVLTLSGDRIAGITSFIGVEHFASLGLPAAL
ncbi:RNA polymerase, sigma-24 subunit, ECF subfamily [Beutenbergia cavernae DSM 12333]|uniref:RNA polymerase, sigma-24 subunit, ECF subfamily n=1 Tax=Beutenbergia cavernae (strain ATCC BAA-8 / DSM 12333 / CCUG 43141 / JCM 11478 / NBRC 16432 / NCIMB 13614 / HKI 0122) TaxID=471853 RepID=C5C199_BEUC1|nr:sigma-70 family RNA polymerase sigma factor [Beutenbergia cavernae]ACQ81509.1 RNA polymerase, sigma-24 subunit, ECF subfamily [Beutenbergia cavernae DSM 12333]